MAEVRARGRMAGPRLPLRTALLALGLCMPLSASALCYFIEEQNPRIKGSLSEEFRSSRWVVLARVIDRRDHWNDETDSWHLYRLQVLRSFKGKPPRVLQFFTFRNSGGFYLDGQGGKPAIGSEWLLFLDVNGRITSQPPVASGTVSIHYPCGVSNEWSKVTPAQKRELERLRAK